MEELDIVLKKLQLRQTALSSAERFNPTERACLGQSALGQSGIVKANIDAILSDADKIYSWLIQDIKL